METEKEGRESVEMAISEEKNAEVFQNPPAEYRGMPFWAWNCRMTEEKVDAVLEAVKEMGMGGAFFHCRTGMDLPYLKEEFMNMMRYAHEKAKEKGLITGLYDEDRWPSGFGGGYVTRQEKYRSRYLVFSPTELPLTEEVVCTEYKSSAEPVPSGKRRFLASYRVRLLNGFLAWYERETDPCGDETAQEEKECDRWFAYLEISGDHPWFNNQAYVDTLNPEAVAEFIRITYDAYEREFGAEFGKEIPFIFTDEPQFSFKRQLGYAGEKRRVTIPYTDDFEESFLAAWGESFLDHLPEIFWELPEGRVSVYRYRYHDHVCERFTRAYADQIGAWCREHHIGLTGHMMREPFLEGQTMALGEAMRAYRSFDVPGIDMLCDRRELTTAKQAQSAVHQYGRAGMMSELYGVTGWDFDFRGHKLAGDWQAALGVTLRVHHLTWTSMAGEAKRDYPASIGSQSPWYREYPVIEDYFARLYTVLRRGNPVVKIGVIHPIESYWLYWGPKEQTQEIRDEMEEHFGNLVKWLLYGLLDFDFLSEALLEEWQQEGEEGFSAGAMRYDAVLIPGCITLRSHTLERLREFEARGGRIIFAGQIPSMVDAVPDERPKKLAARCVTVPFTRRSILESLEEERILDIRDGEGGRSQRLLYQMRRDGDTRILFLSHSEKGDNPDLAAKEEYFIRVKGCWEVVRLRPEDGERELVECRRTANVTYWDVTCWEHDSFLYLLTPVHGGRKAEREHREHRENAVTSYGSHSDRMMSDTAGNSSICGKEVRVPARVPVLLDEPNVLLLDLAEYAFDGGPWQEEEEILRIDNRFRRELGLPLRTEAFAQPWVTERDERKAASHVLSLRYTIQSSIETAEVSLGLEWEEGMTVCWNGEAVCEAAQGWYVDRDIIRLRLPALRKGQNILEVTMPFGAGSHAEAMYLLGDFGVSVLGRTCRLEEPVKELGFGDICMQGLPFYGGTIRYQIPVETGWDGESFVISAEDFRCPVIAVSVDGAKQGLIAFSPYELRVTCERAGSHVLELAAYGNRHNTFGPLHNCNRTERWIGPDAWRSEGACWAYEYQLKPTGILKSPVIREGGAGQEGDTV